MKIGKRFLSLVLCLLVCAAVPSFRADAANKSLTASSQASSFSVGDIVNFGHYEQDTSISGAEALQWKVIRKSGNKLLLLNEYILYPANEDRAFDYNGGVEWKNSVVRKWMNNTFYPSAFSSSEKSIIQYTYLSGYDSVSSSTYDYVFSLSSDEVNAYVTDFSTLCGYATPYAIANGSRKLSMGSYYSWDLRSAEVVTPWGLTERPVREFVCFAMGEYSISTNLRAEQGPTNLVTGVGIRPALYVDLGAAADTTKPTVSCSVTNNTASSQTLYYTLSDNDGIAGYYFGTSSNYSSNTYTSFTGTSVTKTASGSGTYYMTARDRSGNLSSTHSVTLYKTTLDGNGGTVSPSVVRTVSGYGFTLPDASRSGYTFLGYAGSPSATQAEYVYPYYNYYYPSSNKTLYAVWKSNDPTPPSVSFKATNNAAPSQTLTFTMSDNKGVAGYYYGKNAAPSQNTYYKASAGSVYITADHSGTYYFTAKDINGNLSETIPVVIRVTYFDGNGGSVSPSEIRTVSGYGFTLPTASRSGYTLLGYADSASAAQAQYTSSYTPSSNKTLYAVWKNDDSTPPSVSFTATNDVAPSQTLTFTMSDNKGVAGYYYGKNTAPSQNTFYKAPAGSVDIKAEHSGTYYFTAKDINGNLSGTITVTILVTYFDGSGGEVPVSAVRTVSGNSFVLPETVKESGDFLGYSEDPDAKAAAYKGTYTPDKNRTLYAVWETDTYLPGDIDEDGAVTSADARLALRAAVELETLSTVQFKAADVDHNGIIQAADARLILRASVGIEEF